jgi:hypothetical protein
MKFANPFKVAFSIFAATVLAVNTFVFEAKADSTEVIENNNIALNLNSIYGYKHGHLNVSQYTKTPGYDPEQQWNLKDLHDGTFIAESVANPGECINAHNPQLGSTINVMPCDSNDPEQKLKKEYGSIVMANYNYRLNLGDANDTVVKLVPKGVSTTFNPQGTQSETEQTSSSQTKDWSNDLNVCFESMRRETHADNGDFVIVHLNSCGKYYVYMSPGASVELTHFIKNLKVVAELSAYGIGTGGLIEIAKQNPFTAAYVEAISFAVKANSARFEISVNDMEYCAAKGKNMWFETTGGVMMINPTVKCDQ